MFSDEICIFGIKNKKIERKIKLDNMTRRIKICKVFLSTADILSITCQV